MLDFLLIVLIILSALTSTYCNQVRYDNYKVFRIVPTTNEQIEVLRKIENNDGYSFWKRPYQISLAADLQVAPTYLKKFYELMQNAKIEYKLMIDNVQKLLNEEISVNSRLGETFGWTRYHTLDEIYFWMDEIAVQYRGIVDKIIGGRSYQGRQIRGLKLSFGKQKPGIFIEGGIHAREWISPATVTYLIDQLLSSQEPKVRQLAESYDWYIFPNCNPDGYVHTHTVDRLWRKTLSDTGSGPNPKNPNCKGVDLNRNFGFQWMEGSSRTNNPCSSVYAGNKPFSEIEAKSLSEFVTSLSGKLFAYVSFHSYSQLLLFPYGYTYECTDNYDDSLSIAIAATAALRERYNTDYFSGSVSEVMYIATGNTIDWAKGVMKLPLAYTYEMRDTGQYGFLLPPEQIIPNGEEIVDSLVAMFENGRKFGYPKTSIKYARSKKICLPSRKFVIN